MERPGWWNWKLVFTSHVESRMEERGFSEVELRAMLEEATEISRASRPGRWLVQTRHAGYRWTVVLEPDEIDESLVVVTAYKRETD